MKTCTFKTIAIAIFCSLAFTNIGKGQISGKINGGEKVLLPNGWVLSPVGRSLQLGDLPLNLQVSHNKKLIAVTNNGNDNIILIYPIENKKLLQPDTIHLGKPWPVHQMQQRCISLFGEQIKLPFWIPKKGRLHTASLPNTLRMNYY